MEYAAHLPSSRSIMVPLLALAIGAGGAVGVYAALDDSDVGIPQTRVVVTQPPAPLSEGVAAKNEAGTAAAVAAAHQSTAFVGKDEAATAAIIAPSQQSGSFAGKDEARTAAAIAATQTPSSFAGKDEARTAAAIAATQTPSSYVGKDEAKTAAAVGGSQVAPGGGPPAEGRDTRTDPHGPANGLR